MNKRTFGFTLIELLVVIVILGILSTISVGTFRSYFAKARDSERVSTVQNLAMMIKVDSGGSGDEYVYRYGEDDESSPADGVGECISEYAVGSSGDTITLDSCPPLSELLSENDYDMPGAKNGLPFHYCFLAGGSDGVVGHNDFIIVVGAEEDSAQNAEPFTQAATDYRAFIDGTVNGIAALTGGTITWDGSVPTAGGDWVCRQVCDEGFLDDGGATPCD
ncbi:MAG: type II secretion system protein [Candidatus Gracilibacteria bacterium]|nr:type II secretion system protein [Candidatus Gracilibacteria bacterium]